MIAAAGDIACDPANASFLGGVGSGTAGSSSDVCRQKSVADTIAGIAPQAVLDLGDNQYYCGSYNAFLNSYDKSWGLFKGLTYPSVGNHEYLTSGGTSGSTGCDATNSGAAGHYKYFGPTTTGVTPSPPVVQQATQGYYSFNVGTWHLIALNTQCGSVGGCGATSPQGKWLTADLAANTNRCTLAFWHIPLFSSGGRANANSKAFWDALYAAKADVVLTGHDHIYERFAPQTPAGAPDAVNGIREFIAGSGGANHTSLATIAANSVVRDTTTFGALKMTLHAGSYDWQFLPSRGTFTDSSSASVACHAAGGGGTGDSEPPTLTGTLTATAPSATQVNLSWPQGNDNVAVTGYRIYRDAGTTPLATVTSTPLTYTDTTVSPGTAYTYSVSAIDAAGNESTPKISATVTTPALGATSTLPATDDATIDASQPTVNFGANTRIVVDNSPVNYALLKFVAPACSGGVAKAELRLTVGSTASDNSNYGGDVYATTTNTWTEGAVTYATAPAAVGSPVASVASSVALNTSYLFNVTPLVGSGGGIVSMIIKSTSSDGARYFSKEGSPTLAPQLQVTCAAAAGPDTTPPTNALSLTGQGTVVGHVTSFLSGTTVYYNGAAASGRTFQIQNAVADTGSGPASSTFGALGGTSTGFTFTGSTVTTPAGGPYVSGAFTWTAPTGGPTETVTGADNATPANTTATTLTLTDDSTPPTSGALTVNATAADATGTTSSTSSTTFTIGARTDYTDAGSGLDTSTLTVQSATLTNSTCGVPGSGGPFPTPTTITGTTQPAGVVGGYCYLYTLTGTDRVGNTAKISTTVQVAAPLGASASATLTDDATIDGVNTTTNYGANPRIVVDNSPVNNALLKFTVTRTVGCTVNSAKLRLTVGSTANDNSNYGGDVYAVNNTPDWAESTVTYATAPAAVGNKVASVAAVALNTSYAFDVTTLVSPVPNGGTVSMIIKSTSSDGARYLSKEGSPTLAPQLQVTCA